MHFLHTVLQIKAKKFYRYCNATKNWHTHKLFSFLLLGFRMIYLRPAYLNNSISLKTPGALCAWVQVIPYGEQVHVLGESTVCLPMFMGLWQLMLIHWTPPDRRGCWVIAPPLFLNPFPSTLTQPILPHPKELLWGIWLRYCCHSGDCIERHCRLYIRVSLCCTNVVWVSGGLVIKTTPSERRRRVGKLGWWCYVSSLLSLLSPLFSPPSSFPFP